MNGLKPTCPGLQEEMGQNFAGLVLTRPGLIFLCGTVTVVVSPTLPGPWSSWSERDRAQGWECSFQFFESCFTGLFSFFFFPISNVPWSKFFISDSEQKKSSDSCDKILDVWASLQLKMVFWLIQHTVLAEMGVCELLVMIKTPKTWTKEAIKYYVGEDS